jgi:hypothetical protein
VPEFETTAQGTRVATSVGGVLTGLVGQPDKASSGFSRSSMTMLSALLAETLDISIH